MGRSRKSIGDAMSASSAASPSRPSAAARRRPMRPARPVRGRDLADLARDQPKTAAVEGLAERNRYFARTVPAQFDDGRLVAGKTQRRREPGRGGARMDDDVAIAGGIEGQREAGPQRGCDFGAAGIDVDQRNLRAGQLGAQPGAQRTHHPRADDGDPVGRSGRCVPDRVERRLHVGGEHAARRRHVLPAAARPTPPAG